MLPKWGGTGLDRSQELLEATPSLAVLGFQSLLQGGQEVTFHSPGQGCRPPGHYLPGPSQEDFSFIPVKFHLVGFRPVFAERGMGFLWLRQLARDFPRPLNTPSLLRLASPGYHCISFTHPTSIP